MRKHVKGLKLDFPVVLNPRGQMLQLNQSGKCAQTAVFLNSAGEVAYTATSITDEEMASGLAAITGETEVTDPVCGMQINKTSAGATMDYQGKTYYFCSQNCYKLFKQNPGKYAKS